MKVYRVEDGDHRGPYNCGSASFYHPDTGNQPTPWMDVGLRGHWGRAADLDIEENYMFGFDSQAALKAWFNYPDWRQRAEEQGFRVAVYDVDTTPVMVRDNQGKPPVIVDAILHGSRQLCFWKDSARLVETATLSSI